MDLSESTSETQERGVIGLASQMLFLLAFQLTPEARLFLSEDVSLRQWHPLHFYYFSNIKMQENGMLKSNSSLLNTFLNDGNVN